MEQMEQTRQETTNVGQTSEGAIQRPESLPQGDAASQSEMTAQEQMVALKRFGKEEKLPLSKVVDFAQKGFDYNERMAEINREKAALAERIQQESANTLLGMIEDMHKKDPRSAIAVENSIRSYLGMDVKQDQQRVVSELEGLPEPVQNTIINLARQVDQLTAQAQNQTLRDKTTEFDKFVESSKEKHPVLKEEWLGNRKEIVKNIALNIFQQDRTLSKEDVMAKAAKVFSDIKEDIRKSLVKGNYITPKISGGGAAILDSDSNATPKQKLIAALNARNQSEF